ncbi:MAG: hypothetical protein NXI04_07145 [Planctomycetaceae bacterium]|nr:hypothetical protein [Planctomycetaceae bacterium]
MNHSFSHSSGSRRTGTRFACWLIVTGILLAGSPVASAHVKWFSDFDWTATPLPFAELATPTFWAMFALSLVVLSVFIIVDDRTTAEPRIQWAIDWLERNRLSSELVMRIAAFATLLVAWQAGTLLTPELRVDNVWVERAQFVVILLLLWPRTTSLAGVGLAGLWLYGVLRFGAFHMLDYVNALGFAWFLMVRPLPHRFLQATALPVLYSTVGFSLMWLGSEKLVFPQWGEYLLDQNPLLTMGLPTSFFLTSAAFVEIGLGFLLIICVLSRSLSITITLVFFLTTCVFGKVEIIGHTLIHASLIVFLFEGPGHSFTPPSLFHKTLKMRLAFANVNFALTVFAVLFAYTAAAAQVTEPSAEHQHKKFELSATDVIPTLSLRAEPDSRSGWNLQIITENFRFTPESAGAAAVAGEGHVHLYLDGEKTARVYGPWYHLPPLTSGEHEIRVTLNGNDHTDFCLNGEVIAATVTISSP